MTTKLKTYRECRNNPVDLRGLKLTDKTKMVQLTMISCMCDNVSYLKVTKKDGEVSVSLYNDHCALAFSNLQAEPNAKEKIKWAMEDNNLAEVVRLAGSGTEAVAELVIR